MDLGIIVQHAYKYSHTADLAISPPFLCISRFCKLFRIFIPVGRSIQMLKPLTHSRLQRSVGYSNEMSPIYSSSPLWLIHIRLVGQILSLNVRTLERSLSYV